MIHIADEVLDGEGRVDPRSSRPWPGSAGITGAARQICSKCGTLMGPESSRWLLCSTSFLEFDLQTCEQSRQLFHTHYGKRLTG